jgi:hypothetical protein
MASAPPFQCFPALSHAIPGPTNNFFGLFTVFCEVGFDRSRLYPVKERDRILPRQSILLEDAKVL